MDITLTYNQSVLMFVNCFLYLWKYFLIMVILAVLSVYLMHFIIILFNIISTLLVDDMNKLQSFNDIFQHSDFVVFFLSKVFYIKNEFQIQDLTFKVYMCLANLPWFLEFIFC